MILSYNDNNGYIKNKINRPTKNFANVSCFLLVESVMSWYGYRGTLCLHPFVYITYDWLRITLRLLLV